MLKRAAVVTSTAAYEAFALLALSAFIFAIVISAVSPPLL